MLSGEPGLVATTNPRFEFDVDSSLSKPTFHPESPAGKWWARRGHKSGPFVFSDPHLGQGGFGGSTAEFAAVWALDRSKGDPGYVLDSSEAVVMWGDYRSLFQCQKPSGVDLVAQGLGGLCEFGFRTKTARTFRWDFDDFDFLIFRTGHKVKTHEYLVSLELGDVGSLKTHYLSFTEGLLGRDSGKVLRAAAGYRDDLDKRGWLAPETRDLIGRLEENGLVIKGCGALGADTCVAFGSRGAIDILEIRCLGMGLDCISRATGLARGLKMSKP